MDDGYQYFKKKSIMPHVNFLWMDKKWRQHEIMVIFIGELCSS